MRLISKFSTIFLIGFSIPFVSSCGWTSKPPREVKFPIPAPAIQCMSGNLYGFAVDEGAKVTKSKIRKKQSMASLLAAYKVSKDKISESICLAADFLDVKNLPEGNPLTIIRNREDNDVHFCIVEKSKEDYIVVDLRDSVKVYEQKKTVETVRREVAVKIQTTVFKALEDAKLSPLLATKMAEIMQYSFDFFKVKKGDIFKLVYDEQLSGHESISVSNIHAMSFEHDEKLFYAFQHEVNGKVNYYDQNGDALQKAFLRAPLKFSRISSGYTNSRFHPILKIYRPHQGIDYAAPTGTPIYTIGDGDVVEMGYNGGNGNYVKVKHNKTYTTQYLHMSKFAKDLKKGSQVKQGDVIGYVGSTGLATGPHLCFRFWKNGEQINPAKDLDDVRAEPIPSKEKQNYLNRIMEMKDKMDNAKIVTGKALANS
jgi:murein DD-endopeptidase MepM/ murein hydrolase activator NlpD